ncbi:AMP-dependent synthetase and ligase family protein [Hibiscus syriacus]|uniref:AMP-dependent synthetase and ligase family protein n=1 Tax=Hibiscus syriacus TaxID=106335 RepID=A0A6A2ZRC4_HIBSY|nr:AMP-dependent synthetase and ligase family protein [Hibiscus syriacus]
MPSGRPTRSPCLPGELQEIACVMHVPTRWVSEAIRPRPSESIRGPSEHPRPSDQGHPNELCEDIRGQPSELCEGIRGKPSEDRSPGVHGDLQGRPEGMETYVLGRAYAMQHVHSLCLSKGRSPGVHGDLRPILSFDGVEEDDMGFTEEEGETDSGDEKQRDEMRVMIRVVPHAGGSGGGGGCQADECGADLKDEKQYHRRHRVCESHAKAAFVFG